jgi:hypothetical protein
MSQTQTPIRVYEASITILGTYLAISSLFNSSLYQIISTALVQILRMFKITTISSQQITTIIPLLVTFLVFLLIAYDYIMGQPENIINIYQLNLLLVTPEILSYSRLDWLNLIQKPQILDPVRSPLIVFISGAIILVGYLSVYFTSVSRRTNQELITRGIEENLSNQIFIKQSTIAIALTGAAAAVSIIVFVALTPINTILQSIIGTLPYGYLAFGVPGVLLLLTTLWFYLRGQQKEEN